MSRLAQLLSVAAIALTASTATAQSGNQWYFGMSVSLSQGGLYIHSVVPFGPAARAGLEPGDIIYSVNGRNFWGARNDFEAISILQSAVSGQCNGGGGGGGGGTPTVQLVQPQSGQANMIVWDHRTGRQMGVTVYPTPSGGGGGGGVPTSN